MDASYLARRWWLLPLAAVVVAGSIGVNLGHPGPIVLGIVAALLLFAVERTPFVVLAHGLVVGAYFAIGGDNGPIFLTIPWPPCWRRSRSRSDSGCPRSSAPASSSGPAS